jgi:hypothetical protein
MPAQRAEIHGFSRTAFGILEVEAGAECPGAGQHHDRGLIVVLEAAGGVGKLAQRFRRQRIDAVAAVEPHHRNAALRPQALLDFYKLGQRIASLP